MTIPASAPPAPSFREAFEHHLPEMRGLPESEVRRVNLDIPLAGQAVLGVLPRLLPHRDALLALPHVPARAVLELESLTRAMIHAHTRWRYASERLATVGALVQQGLPLRRTLRSAAVFFASVGRIDAAGLGELRGRTGHRDLAMDLLGLASILRPAIVGHDAASLLAPAQLDAAEALGERILATLGNREQSNLTVSDENQLRYRAFTLFIRAYDQVQRGIVFLRWGKDDATKLAPNLFGGGRPRKKHSEAAAEPVAAREIVARSGGVAATAAHGTDAADADQAAASPRDPA